jgi:Xaa-Pro aminopeptidase
MHKRVELRKCTLPEFGLPVVEPKIMPSEYEERIKHVRKKMKEYNLKFLVVYGDREHFSNLEYLTGFDPSFEEAILILSEQDIPTLVIGNECMEYSRVASVNLKRQLWQGFSLLGQPRGQSQSFKEILQDAGLQPGMTGGVAGWKYFSEKEFPKETEAFETPSFLIDTIKKIIKPAKLFNATDIFMDPDYGLRSTNSIDQLAKFEFAAAYVSQAARNVLFHITPGITEYTLAQELRLPGMPLSFHVVLSSGSRASLGFPSPSDREINLGDPFILGLGLRGGAIARAGFVVMDGNQLDINIRDYVDRLVKPYFTAIVAWYEMVGIGITGGELYETINQHIGDSFFGVSLNPGHLIHTDEWLHSPVFKGSSYQLKAGMAIQVDVIPATKTQYFTTNIEDTIVLADDNMQEIMASRYPETWGRIQARKSYMHEELGIQLKHEVLPFSNLPAFLPPYMLDLSRCMKVVSSIHGS